MYEGYHFMKNLKWFTWDVESLQVSMLWSLAVCLVLKVSKFVKTGDQLREARFAQLVSWSMELKVPVALTEVNMQQKQPSMAWQLIDDIEEIELWNCSEKANAIAFDHMSCASIVIVVL